MALEFFSSTWSGETYEWIPAPHRTGYFKTMDVPFVYRPGAKDSFGRSIPLAEGHVACTVDPGSPYEAARWVKGPASEVTAYLFKKAMRGIQEYGWKSSSLFEGSDRARREALTVADKSFGRWCWLASAADPELAASLAGDSERLSWMGRRIFPSTTPEAVRRALHARELAELLLSGYYAIPDEERRARIHEVLKSEPYWPRSALRAVRHAGVMP